MQNYFGFDKAIRIVPHGDLSPERRQQIIDRHCADFAEALICFRTNKHWSNSSMAAKLQNCFTFGCTSYTVAAARIANPVCYKCAAHKIFSLRHLYEYKDLTLEEQEEIFFLNIRANNPEQVVSL